MEVLFDYVSLCFLLVLTCQSSFLDVEVRRQEIQSEAQDSELTARLGVTFGRVVPFFSVKCSGALSLRNFQSKSQLKAVGSMVINPTYLSQRTRTCESRAWICENIGS